jgi:hypothetical protein
MAQRPRPVSAALTADELAELGALRLAWDRRQRAVDTIVRGVQRLIPTFGRRRMTLRQALDAFRREGVTVETSLTCLADGQLQRAGRLRVVLRQNLAREAALYTVFHELGHWVAHPFDQWAAVDTGTSYEVELEASSIGYLALVPHVAGPPYPILVRTKGWTDDGWYLLESRHATGPDTWELRTRRIQPWYAWVPPRYRGCGGIG